MFDYIWIPVLAVGGLGLLFGLALAVASIKFEVKVDERVSKIRGLLPGANCGACGHSGCDSYAEAVAEGKSPINACIVGGNELAAKLGEIMGVEAEKGEKKVARVMCGGTNENINKKYDYFGINDCQAAVALYGGASACPYGCLGLGTCEKACPFDAIVVENGLAEVLPEKCTGCGICVDVCPKNIIELVPVSNEYSVKCSNPDKGSVVRQVCKVGCIGCKLCAKVCPVDAISFNKLLAEINPDVCINCGACVEKCPTGCIAYVKNEYESKIVVNNV
jgi:Na+-translocating ferredoxin:NAD+ oxidoreductase subunit B